MTVSPAPRSGASQPSPRMHIGWLLEAFPTKVPVYLKAEGIAAHTAVVAQSGSGKSFMLGRLLEEIASKSLARLLILDPNADFAQISAVANDDWKFEGDSREAFQQRWNGLGCLTLTKRSQSSFPEAIRRSVCEISLSWAQVPSESRARLLGLSLNTHPEEYGILQEFVEELSLEDLARGVTSSQSNAGVAESFGNRYAPPNQVFESLLARIRRLERSTVWDAGAASTQDRVAELCDPERTQVRIQCLDLGSLDDLEHRYHVATAALAALWESASRMWTRALALPSDQDLRCPVLVVVDEAHNLAPEEPTSEGQQQTVDMLVRIAMEGRKYGLFLILVTQRPSRLNSNLLSQCDNLCLMRMSNPADVQLVEDRFGFVPSGWAQRALEFQKGQILLSGTFVDRPVYAKVAPRRTVEGGRGLRDDAWLRDPFAAS